MAELLADLLKRRGLSVELLDSDITRLTLCSELDFSKDHREENIRRIGFVSKLLSKHGVAVVVAAISPYRATREEVRASMENFVEVYVKAPIQVCIKRDPKGLYKRALAGEILNFTGINDPYEEPETPDIIVDTNRAEPGDCAAQIIAKLQDLEMVRSSALGARRCRAGATLVLPLPSAKREKLWDVPAKEPDL